MRNISTLSPRRRADGFTLLEVMVAMAILAVALTAVLGSQSQSVSLASEAKFSTTAALLAQAKIAELEAKKPGDIASESGDFEPDYPGYTWRVSVNTVLLDEPKGVGEHLTQVDLLVSWGEEGRYEYGLRLYRFAPKKRG